MAARSRSATALVTTSGRLNAAFEIRSGPTVPIPVDGTTLTNVAAITGVHLRVIGMNVRGGFVINSADADQ